jgi:hypothetical protein
MRDETIPGHVADDGVDGISEYPTKWRGNTAVPGGTVPQAYPHLSAGCYY